jgi:hypothetical protein
MCRNWLPFPVYELSLSHHTLPTTSTHTTLSVLTLSCLCLFCRLLSRGTAVHIVCLSFVREVSGLTCYTYMCVYVWCIYVYTCVFLYIHPPRTLGSPVHVMHPSHLLLRSVIRHNSFRGSFWKGGYLKDKTCEVNIDMGLGAMICEVGGALSRPCPVAVLMVLRSFGTYRAYVCLWSLIVFNIL